MSKYNSSRKVPTSRLSRLASFGVVAGAVLGNTVKGATKQLFNGQAPNLQQALLSNDNAESITQRLAKMRGAAMKVGQLLSMDAGEFLPEEWEAIFSRLRQDADAMPKSQLLSSLSNAWGDDWHQHFRYFSFEPIASASIGQVHRAELHDGTELAIKVQYPGVKQSIDSDIDNIASLIKLSGALPEHLDIAPLLEKAKQQLHHEADYELEAQHIEHYTTLCAAHADKFIIPKVYKPLSNAQVLSMSYVEGVAIEQLHQRQHINFAMNALFELMLAELFEFACMQSDPNFANYLFDPTSGKVVLLDFGATRMLSENTQKHYQQLASAMQSLDAKAIMQHLEALQLVHHSMPNEMLEAIQLATSKASECLQDDTYNFADAGLIKQIQEITLPLLSQRKATTLPEFDVALVNRKVSGMVLLANKLKADITLKTHLAPYLS